MVNILNRLLKKNYPNIKVEGVMSHLASSEGKNDKLFLNQIKQFKLALEIFKKHHLKPKWVHIAATGAIVNPETRPIILKVSNMVRTGLSLYGFSSSTLDKNLRPTLKLTTHLGQIKTLKKGETSGYEGTFIAKKDLTIGILPIGYNDGVDRRLSNKGVVTISRVICPIIGRISMNITTIDTSKVKSPYIGMEVLVYSDNPRDRNSIESVAKICKTIPYDVLVHLDTSTKRIVL